MTARRRRVLELARAYEAARDLRDGEGLSRVLQLDILFEVLDKDMSAEFWASVLPRGHKFLPKQGS